MAVSLEKSEQLAGVLKSILPLLYLIDDEYIKEAYEQMYKDASMHDSMAALNPSYNLDSSRLMRTQAMALEHLEQFKETLIECGKLKEKLRKDKEIKEQFKAYFE